MKKEIEALKPEEIPQATQLLATPKYPEWTEAEKLSVRDAQFGLFQTKEQAEAAIKNASQRLQAAVEAVAKNHAVNPQTTNINLNALCFCDKF
jgi:hypothetical protein